MFGSFFIKNFNYLYRQFDLFLLSLLLPPWPIGVQLPLNNTALNSEGPLRYFFFFPINIYTVLSGLQLVESMDLESQLHLTNSCVGQGSTVFQWPPSQSPCFHSFLLECTINTASRVILFKKIITSCQTSTENFPMASHLTPNRNLNPF